VDIPEEVVNGTTNGSLRIVDGAEYNLDLVQPKG